MRNHPGGVAASGGPLPLGGPFLFFLLGEVQDEEGRRELRGVGRVTWIHDGDGGSKLDGLDGFARQIHVAWLKNGHSEQAALISVVVEVSHDFARGELMQGVVGVAGEFVLDGAEDVLDAERGT